MTGKSSTRRWVVIGLLSAIGLAGCGKKGKLYAPEGEEDQYTYPKTYPKPTSQVPGLAKDKPSQNTTSGDISIFPDERSKTKTY